MHKLKQPQSMQFTLAGAWDLEFPYRLLLKLNISAAGDLRAAAHFCNTGVRLTTQTS